MERVGFLSRADKDGDDGVEKEPLRLSIVVSVATG